jgi:hypothetical protein
VLQNVQSKVKLSLCLINEVPHHEDEWESGSVAQLFLTLALDIGEWSALRPGRFTPGKRFFSYS